MTLFKLSTMLALGIALCINALRVCAGDLDPPIGPIEPAGRFGPRTEISDTTTPGDADSLFKITEPGSYYLAHNTIGVAGTSGVEIGAIPTTHASGATLLGEWRFDEGEGNVVHDTSGNNKHGDIEGGPEWIIGFSGFALRFDGDDDYIEIPMAINWDFSAGLTLMTRIRLFGNDFNDDTVVAGNHKSGTGSGYFLGVQQDCFVDFQVYGNVSTPRLEAEIDRDGEWHTVVGTLDATTGIQSLYVDGVLDPKQAYHNALLSGARGCGRRAQSLPTALSAVGVTVTQLSFRHPRPSLSSGSLPTQTGTSLSRRQGMALNTAGGAAMVIWRARRPRRAETHAARGSTPATGRRAGHRFEPPDMAREQTHAQNA